MKIDQCYSLVAGRARHCGHRRYEAQQNSPYAVAWCPDFVVLFSGTPQNRELLFARWEETVFGTVSRDNDGRCATSLTHDDDTITAMIDAAKMAFERIADERKLTTAIRVARYPTLAITVIDLAESTSAAPDVTGSKNSPNDSQIDRNHFVGKRRIDLRQNPFDRSPYVDMTFGSVTSGVTDGGDERQLNVSGCGFSAYRNTTDPSKYIAWSGHALNPRISRNVAVLEALERRVSHLAPHHRFTKAPLASRYIAPEDIGHNTIDGASWIDGTDLVTGERISVPASVVFYGDRSMTHRYSDTSSGCAVGGSLTEAVASGLLEVVERDALVRAWYSGSRPSQLQIDYQRGSELSCAVARLQIVGYRYALYDLETDGAVRCVLAALWDSSGRVGMGSAASFDCARAALSALGEASSVLGDLPRLADNEAERIRGLSSDPYTADTVRDHTLLLLTPGVRAEVEDFLSGDGQITAPDYVGRPEKSEHTVGALLDHVRDKSPGPVAYVETTDDAMACSGLSAVKVIAPGLLPIDFGWSRQRALRHEPYRRVINDQAHRLGAEVRNLPHPYP